MNDLLAYFFGKIETIQEIIDKHELKKVVKDRKNFLILKSKIRKIKLNQENELITAFMQILIDLGFENFEREISAVEEIMRNENSKKLFRPISPSEVQIMTLHKSKGLEFHTVFHVGLEEWVFPYREYNSDWNTPSYPDLEQDTNLHYVGITRAKELCILIQTTRRINSNNEEKNASPSYFLNLPQLQGLYEQH